MIPYPPHVPASPDYRSVELRVAADLIARYREAVLDDPRWRWRTDMLDKLADLAAGLPVVFDMRGPDDALTMATLRPHCMIERDVASNGFRLRPVPSCADDLTLLVASLIDAGTQLPSGAARIKPMGAGKIQPTLTGRMTSLEPEMQDLPRSKRLLDLE